MSHAPSTAQKAGAVLLAAFLAFAPVTNDVQAQELPLRTPSGAVQTQGVRALTDKEAWRESARRIVLHYGDRMEADAQAAVRVLKQSGYSW